MAGSEFEDFKPSNSVNVPKPIDVPKSTGEFDSIPVKFRPFAGATGIMDALGEVWPINSNTGQRLINIAIENNVVPKYVKEETQTSVLPKNEAPVKQEVEIDTATKSSSGDSFFQHGTAPIKEMQQALINLAKDISSHNVLDVQDRQTSKGDGLSGSDPFMNFLVSNYANKAKTQGNQLLTTNIKEPGHTENSKPNDNFKGVLQTITRLGLQGSQAADGNWGPRTNNALKQMYALAYALIQVQQEMGINVSGYADNDLQELYNNIPQGNIDKININEKVAKAQVLLKNLDKLHALYDNFREKVLNNSTYRSQITQEKPLMVSDNKPNIKPYTKNDEDLFHKHYETKLNVSVNGKNAEIMPSNLYSMDAFKKYLNSNATNLGIDQGQLEAINKGDQSTINKYIMDVSSSLSGEK